MGPSQVSEYNRVGGWAGVGSSSPGNIPICTSPRGASVTETGGERLFNYVVFQINKRSMCACFSSGLPICYLNISLCWNDSFF